MIISVCPHVSISLSQSVGGDRSLDPSGTPLCVQLPPLAPDPVFTSHIPSAGPMPSFYQSEHLFCMPLLPQ